MAAPTLEIKNRRAGFEYHLLDSFTCGIQLMGSEIKSIRAGKASINEAFCAFEKDDLVVRNMLIEPYVNAKHYAHEPKRDRRLLLNRSELTKLERKLKDQGITVIPVRLFINAQGRAKLDIALGKGKKLYDKRETMKARDVQRDMDREG
jgi:SsrA-binding protein